MCNFAMFLVLFVGGGWYSSCSDTRSLFTRHNLHVVVFLLQFVMVLVAALRGLLSTVYGYGYHPLYVHF